MKKTFIYGLSALAVTAAMLIPVQAATTTTTTYPGKVVPAHKTVVQPAKKIVTTTKDKGSTVKNITETKTTKTNTTQKMPATK